MRCCCVTDAVADGAGVGVAVCCCRSCRGRCCFSFFSRFLVLLFLLLLFRLCCYCCGCCYSFLLLWLQYLLLLSLSSLGVVAAAVVVVVVLLFFLEGSACNWVLNPHSTKHYRAGAVGCGSMTQPTLAHPPFKRSPMFGTGFVGWGLNPTCQAPIPPQLHPKPPNPALQIRKPGPTPGSLTFREGSRAAHTLPAAVLLGERLGGELGRSGLSAEFQFGYRGFKLSDSAALGLWG